MKNEKIWNQWLYMDLEFHLYVTGLTVALIKVINFCNLYDVSLVLYHYDKLLDIYYIQVGYLDSWLVFK